MRAPAWKERNTQIDRLVRAEEFDESAQANALKEIVWHALETVPFYREQAAFSEGSDPVSILRSLPVVNSQTLRNDLARFVSEGSWVRGLYARTTSGTTGPVTTHIQSLDDEFVSSCAVRGRIERKYGLEATFAEILDLSPRLTNTRGHIAEPLVSFDYTAGERRVWKLQRLSKADAASVTEYQKYGRRKFDVIFGAPSRIEEYLGWCLSCGHNPRPRLIICTFEQLIASAYVRFRSLFDCPVVNLYGSTESGFVGYSDDGIGPIHVQSDLCAVEVLKLDADQPASVGELGRIVVTSFSSWVMPIIRYDIGDFGVINESDDRFGTGFARSVHGLDGRRSVVFLSKSGQRIGAGRILGAVNRNGVWPFQVIQSDPGELFLKLGSEVPAHVQEKVCEKLRLDDPDLFNRHFCITPVSGDLEITRAGKLQLAIQRIAFT